MNEPTFDERPIFTIVVEDLQQKSMKLLGRRLTEDEIISASSGIEAGLLCDLDAVLRTAVDGAVENISH